MAERLRLTFERGEIHRPGIASYFLPDEAFLIENWVPNGTGGLRPRPKWEDGLGSGLAATSVLRSVGYWPGGGGVTVPTTLIAWTDTSNGDFRIYRRAFSGWAAGGGGAWTLLDTDATPADVQGPVAFANGGSLVLWAHYQGASSRIRKWDGTTVADASTVAVAGRALAFHKERFFSGGTDANPTRLYYSGIRDGTDWDLGRYIAIGDDLEPIQDLAVFADSLVIGKRSGLWLLLGDGPLTFTLRPIDRGGASVGRSLAASEIGLLAAGPEDIHLWTGAGPAARLSEPLLEEYISANPLTDHRTVAFLRDSLYTTAYQQDILSRDPNGAWGHDVRNNGNSSHRYVGVFAQRDILIAGSLAGAIVFQDHPGPAVANDPGVSTTYTADTGELHLGGGTTPTTVRHMWLDVSNPGQAISVAHYVDGTLHTTATLEAGTRRKRLDFGGTGTRHEFIITQAFTSAQSGPSEINDCQIEWQTTGGGRGR